MKHSFKLKRAQLLRVFSEKLKIKSVSIENKSDVFNTIHSLLNFIELEDKLTPEACNYNFLNNQVTFQLVLNEEKSKEEFFDSIKTFDAFLTE